MEAAPETPPAEATADDVDAAAAHLSAPLLLRALPDRDVQAAGMICADDCIAAGGVTVRADRTGRLGLRPRVRVKEGQGLRHGTIREKPFLCACGLLRCKEGGSRLHLSRPHQQPTHPDHTVLVLTMTDNPPGRAGELSTESQTGAGGDGAYPQQAAPQHDRAMNVRSTLSGDGVDYFNTLSVEGAAVNIAYSVWSALLVMDAKCCQRGVFLCVVLEQLQRILIHHLTSIGKGFVTLHSLQTEVHPQYSKHGSVLVRCPLTERLVFLQTAWNFSRR